MSNLAKIYTEAVNPTLKELDQFGIPEKPPKQNVEQEDATQQLRTDLKLNWLNSQVTQELFASLVKEETLNVDRAIKLAVTEGPQPDYLKIVRLLQKVDNSRKIREQYGNLS